MKVAIPNNYPVVGRDVFSTATGVHAAAILKAQQMNDTDLEDLIYSSVPAKMLARSQQIKIGSMSGKANVIAWLNAREIFPDPELVSEILMHAKTSSEVLKDKDILTLVKKFTSSAK
jgi:2-isopropylmalate synthase